MRMLIGMAFSAMAASRNERTRLLGVTDIPGRRDDALGMRQGQAFQVGRVGHGHFDAADPPDRRVQPVEGQLHHLGDENGEPIRLYRGAGGRLYYKDGSPIDFDSVRKQLQDLQSEQRISTVR